ncbi:STAS domain-containing protein [Mycobacterium asiaticum]|uniref:Anti-sigma factor antagonist n=1 Tax=Mycobacterium asiaticum TaxID=1790 RepID=A0A1A3KCC9_MYCAS|nr:STAS domain-containing protein [Mycobacterium asiaticum]OBI91045.1 anti-anti-sigma factor [Mycobacterium asiaticum]OBJ58727.1 anti-anti-sigma factor [Mycobacterium asiaticum]OBJ82064.1 anti-anti-sigma factor [Mycobacterium asiaticum]ORA14786.1 anti-anti-sigma factor [Mycobacterium asiaticum DSM 44297]
MVDQPGDPVNRASFEVEQHERDGAVVLAVSGEVDMLSAPQLAEAISTSLAHKPAALIVDLSKVEFLASAGLSVLVNGQAEVVAPTKFAVVADGPATSRPIKLMGIDSLLSLHRTLDNALSWVAGA